MRAGPFRFGANGASQNSAEEAQNINEGAESVKTKQNESGSQASKETKADSDYKVPENVIPAGPYNELRFKTYELRFKGNFPNAEIGLNESIMTSLPERGAKALPMSLQVDGVGTMWIGYFREEHTELPEVQSWVTRIDQLSRGLWKCNRTGDQEGFGQDLSRALHVKGHIRSDQMFMDLAIEAPEISQRMIDDPEGVKNAVNDFVDQLSNGEDLSANSYHERWRDFLWFRKRFGRNLAIEDYHKWIKAGKGDELPKAEKKSGKAKFSSNEKSAEELRQEALGRYTNLDVSFPAPMEKEAFYGVFGDVVSIIEPISEASPEAVLAQLIIALGNVMGRGAYRYQGSRHHLNEFGVIVGKTSRGRKGTSWKAVENLLNFISQGWLSDRVMNGIQSGEAIVYAVRDEREGVVPIEKRKKGEAANAEIVTLDPGIEDKRLLMMEEEFSRLLTVAGRNGSSISPNLRDAWDGKQYLHNNGKHSPDKATDAHISLIGHITKDELLSCMKTVEHSNGFGNRILWVASQRVKKLPIPGWVYWDKYPKITGRISDALNTFSKDVALEGKQLKFSQAGEKTWCDFYYSIDDTQSGVIASLLARTEAHVLRLAMIFTAFDNSCSIQPKQINAAIAFWRYCEASVRWGFVMQPAIR